MKLILIICSFLLACILIRKFSRSKDEVRELVSIEGSHNPERMFNLMPHHKKVIDKGVAVFYRYNGEIKKGYIAGYCVDEYPKLDDVIYKVSISGDFSVYRQINHMSIKLAD